MSEPEEESQGGPRARTETKGHKSEKGQEQVEGSDVMRVSLREGWQQRQTRREVKVGGDKRQGVDKGEGKGKKKKRHKPQDPRVEKFQGKRDPDPDQDGPVRVQQTLVRNRASWQYLLSPSRPTGVPDGCCEACRTETRAQKKMCFFPEDH